jgi:hypothetical protein
MKTSVTDLLTDARKVLEQFDLCKNSLACDASGKPTHYCDGRAIAFCILGALYRAADCCDYASGTKDTAQEYLRSAIPFKGPIDHYNDYPTRTKIHVLAVYDRAIAAAAKTGV